MSDTNHNPLTMMARSKRSPVIVQLPSDVPSKGGYAILPALRGSKSSVVKLHHYSGRHRNELCHCWVLQQDSSWSLGHRRVKCNVSFPAIAWPEHTRPPESLHVYGHSIEQECFAAMLPRAPTPVRAFTPYLLASLTRADLKRPHW